MYYYKRTSDDVNLHDQLIWNLHINGIDELMLFLGSNPNEVRRGGRERGGEREGVKERGREREEGGREGVKERGREREGGGREGVKERGREREGGGGEVRSEREREGERENAVMDL